MTATRHILIARWEKWLEVLFQQLVELHHDRAIWQEIVTIVEANRDILEPWFFLDWIRRLWTSTMLVGVRRLDDHDPRSVSLARLLADILANPDVVSRSRYCDLFAETYPGDAFWQVRANEEFDKLVGAGVDHVTADMLESDLARLRDAAAIVRNHVNKYVAHTEEQAGPPSATYSDLDHALDGVTEVYFRYSRLITGSAPMTMVPVMQQDWKRPFLVAWAPDERHLRLLQERGQVPRPQP